MCVNNDLVRIINGVWHIRSHMGDSFQVMRDNERIARGLINKESIVKKRQTN